MNSKKEKSNWKRIGEVICWFLALGIVICWLPVLFWSLGKNEPPKTIECPKPARHFIIAYDRSGSMHKYQSNLHEINQNVVSYLTDHYQQGDMISIVLLGLTKTEWECILGNRERVKQEPPELAYMNLCQLKGEAVALSDVQSELDQIANDLNNVGFQRNVSLCSMVQSTTLNVAPDVGASSTFLIWITDGETNDMAPGYREEAARFRNDLEGGRPRTENLIQLVSELTQYKDHYSVSEIKSYDSPVVAPDGRGAKIGVYEINPKRRDQAVTIRQLGSDEDFNDASVNFWSPWRLLLGSNLVPKLNVETGYQLVTGCILVSQNNQNILTANLNNQTTSTDLNEVIKNLRRKSVLNSIDLKIDFLLLLRNEVGRTFLVERSKHLSLNSFTFDIISILFAILFILIAIWLRAKTDHNIAQEKVKDLIQIVTRPPLPIDSIDIVPTDLKQNVEGTANGHISLKLSENIDGEVNATVSLTEDTPSYVYLDNDKKAIVNIHSNETLIPFKVTDIPDSNRDVSFGVKINIPKDHKSYLSPEPNTPDNSYRVKFTLLSPHTHWKWEIKNQVTKPIEIGENNRTKPIFLGTISFRETERNRAISREEILELIKSKKLHIDIVEVGSDTSTIKEWLQNTIFICRQDTKTEKALYLYLLPENFGEIKTSILLNTKIRVQMDHPPRILVNPEESFGFKLIPDLGDWHFAIDFGTSATTVAFGKIGEEHHKVLLAKLDDAGNRWINSNIYIKNQNGQLDCYDTGVPKIELGEDAEISRKRDSSQNRPIVYGFSSIKKLIGAKNILKVGEASVDVEKILAGILQELYNRLIKYNKDQIQSKDIKRVTLSIPNTFSPGKIELMKRACAMVENENGEQVFEKDNINIIREAEAVASCYVHSENISNNHYFLVYDLGAGTLDIALVQLLVDKEGNKTLDILHRLGYPVGGDRLDVMIAETIWDHFLKAERKRLDGSPTKEDMFAYQIANKKGNSSLRALRQELNNTSKAMKENLGKEDGAATFKTVSIPFVDLKRYWEEHNDKGINYMKLAVDQPLANLIPYAKEKLGIDHIDKVLVSGRASFFPGLKERLAKNLCDYHFIPMNVSEQAIQNAITEQNQVETSIQAADEQPDEKIKQIVESELFAFNRFPLDALDVPNKSNISLSKYCLCYGSVLYSLKRHEDKVKLSNERIYGTYCAFHEYTPLDGNIETYEEEGKHKPYKFVMKEIIPKGENMKLLNPSLKSATGRTNGVNLRGQKLFIYYAQGNNPRLDFEKGRMLELDCVFSDKLQYPYKYYDVEMEIFNNDTWKITIYGEGTEPHTLKDDEMSTIIFDVDFAKTTQGKSKDSEELKYKYWPYTEEDFPGV